MASPELIDKHKDVDPFLLWKWERIFNAFFDRDRSHEVDSADFYIIVRKVKEIYGAESKQMEYARNSLTALWNGLVEMADKNKDEKIEVDEWVSVLKKLDPTKQSKWFNEYSNYMFKLFDVSEDQKLDLAEYADGMVAYGFKESDAHEAFRKFAVDKNGKSIPHIDYQQFKKLWLEYFHSTDHNAMGNNLFGPLEK